MRPSTRLTALASRCARPRSPLPRRPPPAPSRPGPVRRLRPVSAPRPRCRRARRSSDRSRPSTHDARHRDAASRATRWRSRRSPTRCPRLARRSIATTSPRREFAQRFGATPDQVQAVQASLQAHGLNPGSPSANGLSIPVTATAGTVAAGVQGLVRARHAPERRQRDRQPAGAHARRRRRARRAGGARTQHPVASQATARTPACGDRSRRAYDRESSPADRSRALRPQPRQGAAGRRADRRRDRVGLRAVRPLPRSGDLGAGQTVAVLELEPYDLSRHRSTTGSATQSTPQIANVAGRRGRRQRLGLRRGGPRHRERDRPGAAGEHRGLRRTELRLGPVRHVQRDHQPARRPGGHRVVGPVRVHQRHSAQAIGREHPVPGGRRAGTVDRLGLGRRGRRGLLPDAADRAGRRPGQPAVRDRRRRHQLEALGPPPSESVWNDMYPTRRQRRRRVDPLEDARLPDRHAGLPARDQRGLLRIDVRGVVGLLPGGARRGGRRRPGHRLRDLLERRRRGGTRAAHRLAGRRRHERRGPDLGGADRAHQRLGRLPRPADRLRQPRPVRRRGHRLRATTSTTPSPATTT